MLLFTIVFTFYYEKVNDCVSSIGYSKFKYSNVRLINQSNEVDDGRS